MLPLLLLFCSGAFGAFVHRSILIKYVLFVFAPLLSIAIFILQIFIGQGNIIAEWLIINKISIEFSMTFGLMELFICSIITIIAMCVQLSYIHLESFSTNKKTAIPGLLNIFSSIMCFSILSNNFFNFFIGIEGLGLMSSIFVGLSDNSSSSSTRTYIINKFSSLLFLTAIVLIAIQIKSLDFLAAKIAFQDIVHNPGLKLPAIMLLIACLCKGAQFPFSYWLIDATKASIYVSILLHSATIVGIGIIFISKCYFIFESIPMLKTTMIAVGGITAALFSICSLCHIDVKKIIACSTVSSMGMMFIACGLGEYSIAILYFICHAFFKSVFFLSFNYVINAMSKEYNILKMGGINKIIPNINDIVWISFMSTIGLPFFVSFFAKVSLLSALFNIGNTHIAVLIIVVNIISIITLFRLIMLSLYGRQRGDDSVLARITDAHGTELAAPWILITCAVFGSFIAWSMYEWDILHFGMSGIVYTRTFIDSIGENTIELVQIAIAILSVVWITRLKKSHNQKKIELLFIKIFRENTVSTNIFHLIQMLAIKIFEAIAIANDTLDNFLNKYFFKLLNAASLKINRSHRSSIMYQMHWILFGVVICILYAVFWKGV